MATLETQYSNYRYENPESNFTFEQWQQWLGNQITKAMDILSLGIEVGKTYTYYDDGKIRESRKHEVTITEIIPFNEADNRLISYWQEEVNNADWVYSPDTDYFIKANLILGQGIKKIVFVRTLYGRWFSLGWWAGLLKID